MEKTDTQGSCTYKQGSLPACAPLALSQIPAQQSSEPAYKSAEDVYKRQHVDNSELHIAAEANPLSSYIPEKKE